MKDDATARLAKAGKLLEVLQEYHQHQGDLIDEISVLLGGGDGIGALLKRGQQCFDHVWSTLYPGAGAYVWNYKVDAPNLKRLIKKLGIDELEARMGRFMTSSEPFITSRPRTFGVFVATINQHAAPAQMSEFELDPATFLSCKHVPKCYSDVEHTKRRAAEMREAF